MQLCRILIAAAALLLLVAGAARAQYSAPRGTQVQLQYHQLVPAGADTTPVFLKIIDKIRNDCRRIGEAFGRKCIINNINIYTNAVNTGEMVSARMVNATASIMLPEPTGAPPSTGAPQSPPATASRPSPSSSK